MIGPMRLPSRVVGDGGVYACPILAGCRERG
jgi:hypothetical protein